MSQEFESDSKEIGCTRSGKRYKVDFGSSFFEDSSNRSREQSQVIEKHQQGVSLTTLIPHRKWSGLRIIPQELHLVVHTQYILPLHHLHLHCQVVVIQQIRINHIETECGMT